MGELGTSLSNGESGRISVSGGSVTSAPVSPTTCRASQVSSHELPHVEPALPKALEELSERQRAALLLIHVEGLTERDAAKAMGVSRVTVRRHADRALNKLRSFLEVEDG